MTSKILQKLPFEVSSMRSDNKPRRSYLSPKERPKKQAEKPAEEIEVEL